MVFTISRFTCCSDKSLQVSYLHVPIRIGLFKWFTRGLYYALTRLRGIRELFAQKNLF